MATLTIENVRKSYGDVEVLKGIDLAIESGEFLILVGPSGCGKSTLMNTIAGLEALTAGEIYIDGNPISHLPPKERNIAMVFQSYALYPSMTVAKNIEFALEIAKMPKAERQKKVKEVATLLQIDHLLDRKPGQLSGGQRQRVAIGRALAREPAIYLFDEPLSNLDAKLRVEMRTELKKLHHRLKTTIVYVTHDQIEAMTLADRIAVMKDGIVQQFGTPQELYDDPANRFVAGFIGSPSMNFLDVEVTQQGNEIGIQLDNQGQTMFLPLSAEDQQALSHRVGQMVTLGIRPEQITHRRVHKIGEPLSVTFEALVDVIEPTGADTLVMITLNDREITCRVDPRQIAPPGEQITLMADMSKAVLFDPQTHERIR